MRALTVTATIGSDHTLTAQLPPDGPPGARAVVIVPDEPVSATPARAPLKFSAHPVGLADDACTFRREDIYGADGR